MAETPSSAVALLASLLMIKTAAGVRHRKGLQSDDVLKKLSRAHLAPAKDPKKCST